MEIQNDWMELGERCGDGDVRAFVTADVVIVCGVASVALGGQ